MKLNYKEFGSGKPLIILHGLMGSLDNWHSLANQFALHFKVFTIDARNHGRSPHSEEHSIPLMVMDLFEFINEHGLSEVSIIGHSMGGKVAMQFAMEYPQLLANLIVVDIAPRQYMRGHDDVFAALFAVNLTQVHTRKDAEDKMLPYLKDAGTRQFLLKNLERNTDATYQWRINLQALHNHYNEIISPIVSLHPFTGRTLFIMGSKSDYITETDIAEIKTLFPGFKLVTVANAGHWVHADNPKEFYATVMDFIN
ncbi:MAG: alpha/beta fold hydrolase [Bacteroidia bacterium]|nr:alpha/beta fold hydrolase [Bacteroidia bacterium]